MVDFTIFINFVMFEYSKLELLYFTFLLLGGGVIFLLTFIFITTEGRVGYILPGFQHKLYVSDLLEFSLCSDSWLWHIVWDSSTSSVMVLSVRIFTKPSIVTQSPCTVTLLDMIFITVACVKMFHQCFTTKCFGHKN